jgi:hypothetical protein
MRLALKNTGITGPVAEPETDTEARGKEQLGPSGPRIRCPLCGWSPTKNDLWVCVCGNAWNTFDTGGVCPACLHQWTETQCPPCHQWSSHSDWYEHAS